MRCTHLKLGNGVGPAGLGALVVDRHAPVDGAVKWEVHRDVLAGAESRCQHRLEALCGSIVADLGGQIRQHVHATHNPHGLPQPDA